MPTCKECNLSFSVHADDQKILDYFHAPAPTLCPPHSLRQRLSFRNERHLFKRTCELCKKEMLAMYSPNSYPSVYCHECWYGDSWDPMNHGRVYDPTRSFIDQVSDLLQSVPHFNLFQIGENINSDYCNAIYNSKDSFLSFSNVRSEGSLYCKNTDDGLDCTDCFGVAKSELLYDCVSVNDSYKSAYLTRCEKCSECYLGRDLSDCQNCFGCVNLKHKQWYWYNEQLSEGEYKKRLARALESRRSFNEQCAAFNTFSESLPVEYATIRSSEDATGSYIYNSRNIRNSFFNSDSENNGDCFRTIWNAKDCYRVCNIGAGEGSYNSIALPFSSFAAACFLCEHCSFVSYCFFCQNTDSALGCVGLRKKKFCILNTQYSEEEYKALSALIRTDMKQRGEWGEFFPVSHSQHGYNNTLAYEYFPLSKEEVITRGWRWEDETVTARGKETLAADAVPESIDLADASITKQILACASCGMNYKILKKELERLKLFHLPLPLQCQDCRFTVRFERHIVPVLYHRTCMCRESHVFHEGSSCTADFQTTYRPDGKDSVYCKPCYQECVQ